MTVLAANVVGPEQVTLTIIGLLDQDPVEVRYIGGDAAFTETGTGTPICAINWLTAAQA